MTIDELLESERTVIGNVTLWNGSSGYDSERGRIVRFTGYEKIVLKTLLVKPGEIVSEEEIDAALEAGRGIPGHTTIIRDRAIRGLQAKLGKGNIVHKQVKGYYAVVQNKPFYS